MMKASSDVRNYIVLICILLSFNVWAQPDLTVTTNTPYQFPSDGLAHQIEFTVSNVGDLGAADGVTINFSLLDPSLQFNGVTSGDIEWDCTNLQNGNNCLFQGNLTPFGGTTTLNVEVVYPNNNANLAPALTAVVGDVGGSEVVVGNNNTSVDIEYVTAGSVDLVMVKTISPGFPTTVTPTDAFSFDLEVTNLSGVDATNIFVMDDVAINHLIFDAANSSPECDQISVFVECNLPTLLAGNSFVFKIATTVDLNAIPGNYINSATVSAAEPESDNANNTDTQPFTIALGGAAEIEVIKSIVGNPTQVLQGDTIDYLIEVNNTGVTDALNVDLTDALPMGVTYQSHMELGPNFLCNYSAPTLTCNAPNLPNTVDQDGVRITVLVDGAVSSVITNTASSAFIDGNTTDNSDSVMFTVQGPSADLDLTMIADSSTYNQGDVITLDLTLHNPFSSTGAPPNTTVTTNLPNEVVFNSAQVNVAGWSCIHDGSATGGVVTCDSQGNPVTIGTNTLIGITAFADTPGTVIQPTAVVTSDFDPIAGNNNANTFFDIFPASAELSLQFVSVPGVYNQGDSIFYDIQLNNSMASATSPSDVMVDIALPPEVSFVNTNVSSAPGWFCNHDGSPNGGIIICDRQGTAFPIFSTHNVTVEVLANSPTPTAIVQANIESSTDTTLGDNSDNQSDVINGAPVTTLTATKSALVGGINVTDVAYGSAYDYELRVDNTGLNDAFNVHISDNLPPDVVLTGFDTTGWTCMPLTINGVNQVVDCTLVAPLAAGGTAQILLNVLATNNTAITSITNQMSTAGDNTGPLVSSNNLINLLNPAGSLLLSQNPSPVDPGSVVNFDVQFENKGTLPLTSIQIDSNVPSGFVFNSFNAGTGVFCAASAGMVNCTSANPLLPGDFLNLTISFDTPAVLTPGELYAFQVFADALELTVPVDQTLNTNFGVSNYSVTLTSNLAQAQVGDPFIHSMSINNNGSFDLTDVEAFFVFPPDAELLEFQSADMNCVLQTDRVLCRNIQPIAGLSSVSASFTMRSNTVNSVINTDAIVNADGVIKRTSASTQIIESIVSEGADLSLRKTASVAQVSRLGLFSYLFDVTNTGLDSQSSFTITDQLPSGVIFQGFAGSGWSCDGSETIICHYNDVLISGAVSQLQLNVAAPDSIGIITNTALVESAHDDNPANNQSSVNVNVVEGTGGATINDLAVEMSVNAMDLLTTDNVSWTIEVVNNGPDAASNVHVDNKFPFGFVAEEFLVNGGASCILLNTSLVCDIGSMAVNQPIQITLNGGFNNGFEGMMMNIVDVSADGVDPDLTNNQGSAYVNVTLAENLHADLSLDLLAENQDIRQGDVFDMTLKSMNNGPDRAVGAMINANINGLISDVQVLNAGQWICQSSISTITCHFPTDYPAGLMQDIDVRITTEQVVQVSEPIIINANIEAVSFDPHPGNNMTGFSNEVARTPTEEEIFTLFEEAVGSGASDTVLETIRGVSSYCARSFFTAIEGLCEEMIEGATPENGGAIINAMEEITPNEVIGQSTSAAEIISSQFRNVGSRLSQLRGGGGAGLSISGLNGRYGNESIPLGMLSYLNQSEDEQQSVSNINDFVSPWGFFVNGTISMGERDATGRELGFDFDTYGLTAGVDYRFSPTKVAGVALGYANFDSEIEDEAAMKSTGFTLTGYGSFYLKDNFYVDARISYGNPDFEQERRINFAIDDIVIDRVATGKTDASQYSVAMSMGYHFNKNSWNITPNASIQYVRTTIDAFNETGAGDFNFAFGEQEVKSMVWSFGTSVSKAISLKNGVLSPQFDINISRETENDGGLLEARFINAPLDELLFIQTDEPDRTYGSAGIGLVFIGANGKQAYINYRSIFGLEGFTRGTINLGARFEF